MEENKNINLNNVNEVQNNSNTGVTPSAPSFSSTSSQNIQPSSTPKFSTSSSIFSLLSQFVSSSNVRTASTIPS